MTKAIKLELKFIKKQKESKDAFSFYFKRPEDFDFIPGQYLKLFLDILNPDDRGSGRYFTISSSPLEKDYLTITTRIIKSSFKLKLDSLNPGDKVTIFGPIGYFDFYPEKQKNAVFIAGGIGVTPFYSILKKFEFEKFDTNMILLNSFDYKENVIFFDEFKEIEKNNPNFKIIFTLTKYKNSNPDFENGRISIEMIKKYVPNYLESNFFITGSEKMVLSVFDMIKEAGVLEEKIFKEDFPGY